MAILCCTENLHPGRSASKTLHIKINSKPIDFKSNKTIYKKHNSASEIYNVTGFYGLNSN